MRILHFREAFSSLSETFIYDSYVEQVKRRLDCHFAAVHRVDAETRPAPNVHLLRLPPRAHPARIASRLLGRLRGLPRWERPFPLYAHGLRAVVEQVRPDVVHAHFGTAGVIAELATRGLRLPLVVTFYGYDVSHLPRERRWRDHYRRLFEGASQITVLSEDMRREVLALGSNPNRTQVVHLSRNIEELAFTPQARRIQRWLSVGRLVEKKGFADAIGAIALLRDRKSPAELEIVGEGPLFPDLSALIESLGLETRVRLSGALPNSEVLRRLQNSDAFLLCSKTASNGDKEGTPTVLIEAQAMGRPCVSTQHAGIPEMFPAAARSLLAREGSIEEIATLMDQVMRLDAAARSELVRAGREHVQRGFSVSAQAAEFAELYAKLALQRRESSDG